MEAEHEHKAPQTRLRFKLSDIVTGVIMTAIGMLAVRQCVNGLNEHASAALVAGACAGMAVLTGAGTLFAVWKAGAIGCACPHEWARTVRLVVAILVAWVPMFILFAVA